MEDLLQQQSSCRVWSFLIYKRSQNFQLKRLENTQFPVTVDAELEWMSFISSVLGKQKGREGKKKANRQLNRHFLSAGRGVYPTTSTSSCCWEPLSNWKSLPPPFLHKGHHQETAQWESLQPGRSHGTTKLPFLTTELCIQTYAGQLSVTKMKHPGGFHRQTDAIARSVTH